MENVGDILRGKRIEKRYTLEAVSSAVGVSINYISKLEKGENFNPSDEVIFKLALALDIDEDSLFISYGKIPLSTRKVLVACPTLSRLISQVSREISTDDLEGFLNKMLHESTY
jgi:transcriptional regulator with XRE-family HTH domain